MAEEFFNKYVQISEKRNIVIATSVYCFDQKFHETKPYFKDRFLNTGKITYIFYEIVNYILIDECEGIKFLKDIKSIFQRKNHMEIILLMSIQIIIMN